MASNSAQSDSPSSTRSRRLSPDSICPICQHTPVDPFVTPCGHTFCYQCISVHLQKRSNCPTCATYMTPDNLTPQYGPDLQRTPELNTTSRPREPPPPPSAGRRRRRGRGSEQDSGVHKKSRKDAGEGLLSRILAGAGAGGDGGLSEDAMVKMTDGMSTESIAKVIQMLNSTLEKKKDSDKKIERDLLLMFLKRALHVRRKAIERTMREVRLLTQDLERIEGSVLPSERRSSSEGITDAAERTAKSVHGSVNGDGVTAVGLPRKRPRSLQMESLDEGGGKIWSSDLWRAGSSSLSSIHNVNTGQTSALPPAAGSSASISEPGNSAQEVPTKGQMSPEVFSEFQKSYFSKVGARSGSARTVALESFTEDMMKYAQYSRFRCRATLMHGHPPPETLGNSDLFDAYNIVSWIEFDRESEYIATAGVTKRIKIYEFSNITRDTAPVHYPVKEIVAPAKLSCLSWNSYIRQLMVTSDYDGNIMLWDAQRGASVNEYEGHDKRAWSVTFNRLDPTMFASGSDDGRVKIWSTNQLNSLMTIENKNKLNVCSVKFNPGVPHQIAYGSLDHCVHYFDLRNMREPLHVFTDHTRTVSYVDFLSPTELVSTCNDSTVKVWDMNNYQLLKTYRGHTNEKHFVGLSVTKDYIAAGSEDNAVYAYYKAVSRPFASYKFGTPDLLTGEETEETSGPQFISSVCWCPKNPRICLGANSQGLIKVLELEE